MLRGLRGFLRRGGGLEQTVMCLQADSRRGLASNPAIEEAQHDRFSVRGWASMVDEHFDGIGEHSLDVGWAWLQHAFPCLCGGGV